MLIITTHIQQRIAVTQRVAWANPPAEEGRPNFESYRSTLPPLPAPRDARTPTCPAMYITHPPKYKPEETIPYVAHEVVEAERTRGRGLNKTFLQRNASLFPSPNSQSYLAQLPSLRRHQPPTDRPTIPVLVGASRLIPHRT